jgi:hypothetical protein
VCVDTHVFLFHVPRLFDRWVHNDFDVTVGEGLETLCGASRVVNLLRGMHLRVGFGVTFNDDRQIRLKHVRKYPPQCQLSCIRIHLKVVGMMVGNVGGCDISLAC